MSAPKIRGKYREVSTTELAPNPWNPNKQSDFMFERQQESLRQMSFLDPILVRSSGGRLEIIDGEHRWRAAQEVGQDVVSVIDLGEVPDHEAKQLTILLNELRGKPERTALAALINELLEGEGADLARAVLPYTEAEMTAFAEMTSFDWSTLDDGAPPGDQDGAEGAEGGKVTFTVSLPQEGAQTLRTALERADPRPLLRPLAHRQRPRRAAP